MSMGDGKAKNVIEYLDNLVERGLATKGAITPLRIAFTKVLQVVDGATWEDTEVRAIDVEDYLLRFANLTMGKYTTHSLTVYKSRVNKAVNWYLNMLDKPGWTPSFNKRDKSPKPIKPTTRVTAHAVTKSSVSPSHSQPLPSMPSVANAPDRVLYPFPLSDGQLVHISLPFRLSRTDASRIGAFVESIAVDESKEVSM